MESDKNCVAVVIQSTHSIPMESRDTPTTSRSRMLNELRQKEPLCRKAPYTVIWWSHVES